VEEGFLPGLFYLFQSTIRTAYNNIAIYINSTLVRILSLTGSGSIWYKKGCVIFAPRNRYYSNFIQQLLPGFERKEVVPNHQGMSKNTQI